MPFEKYNVNWPDGWNELLIELTCFREDSFARFKIPQEQRAFHFKRIVSILWGSKSKKPYIWNPWADLMLQSCIEENYISFSGCASSGKTSFGAIWGLVNWMCSPHNTLILLTSTSLEDARRRIWGELEAYYMAANDSLKAIQKGAQLPGRLLGATGKVRTQEGNQKYGDKCGIQLIAGDRSKEKENIGKLIGLKNKRVFLIADELPELSPALVEAAMSNLMTNRDPEKGGVFQMIGLGNFASIYDPFGVFSEPIDGWASINPDMDRWRTKNGICLRFDGLKSPNVLLGEQRYPGQYGPSHLKQHRESFGENSALFWRMCRSYPCPEADADRIYSDADLVKGNVKGTVKWREQPIKCASLDPAFATGGDKAIACIGLIGYTVDNVRVLQLSKVVELKEDVRKKDESRSTQIAKGFRDLCLAEGIDPKDAAVDISGGGLPFAALLTEVWNDKFLGVQFGGAPSMRAASSKDRRPAKDAFSNRVAEIWFAGIDFIQGGQVKGLTNQICIELTERRRLPAVKGATGIKLRIEQKTDMKKRTGGRSPDDADSFLILLELCRERLNFQAQGMEGNRGTPARTFQQRVRLINQVYQNVSYEAEEIAA